ncbi:MAG TPA: membrane or secreted protein, partial [Flavisolibacter sp.]|nr:membrane or secreted protein [Flavisolibacter sp.]
KGNFLPNVDQYSIPFNDTIPAFKNRAKMVYEFDAGDVMQPIMYPAMARSYRTAGFQWATQFAYDPLYTAHANTEYQTHYLNLAYTPSKAISLLIASKAFHRLPRGKSYGAYPADTLFDVFRVSYKEQLSEMNSEEEFYYTSSTATQPKNITKLKHIAGVGNSPLVQYEGTGAYFLDKMSDGAWRLEVMPDAVEIKDPFEKASPQKEVVKINSKKNLIQLLIPELQSGFTIYSLNKGNDVSSNSGDNQIIVGPGIYMILKKEINMPAYATQHLEFYVPVPSVANPLVVHQQLLEVSAGKPFVIHSKIAGINNADKVSVEIRNSSNQWKTVQMQNAAGYEYKADVSADIVTPGVINYRIMISKASGDTYTFPGGFKGNPYAWDEYRNESWQTFVAAPDGPLEIFNPTTDRSRIMLYNPDWRANTVEYITAGKPHELVLKATMSKPDGTRFMGWQYYFSDKIAGRKDELSSFTKLVIRARASTNTQAKLSLITTKADAFAAAVSLTTEWRDIEIPLTGLQKDSFLLLPRPYPGFLPLRFSSNATSPLLLQDAERIEISFGEGVTSSAPLSIEVASVYLKK